MGGPKKNSYALNYALFLILAAVPHDGNSQDLASGTVSSTVVKETSKWWLSNEDMALAGGFLFTGLWVGFTI
jgi:hypothetical protein